MKNPLLLFDIDGTLVNSQGAGAVAMRQVCANLFGDQFSFDEVHFPGKLDHAIFAEATGKSGFTKEQAPEAEFRQAYAKQLAEQMNSLPPGKTALPGVLDLLSTLRNIIDSADRSTNNKPILGLLTGNYSNTGPIKLKAAGIDSSWFTISIFCDEADTRPGLTEVALRRYAQQTGQKADPSQVIVIGDTPLDVHCAKEHNCVAFGVGTGEYTPKQLLESGADYAVENLCDPAPLLDLINRA